MKNITLQRRPIQDVSTLSEIASPLLRKLYAQRGITHLDQLEKGAKALLTYQSLAGIEAAVDLLCNVLEQQKRIVVVGDFDADGATSSALAVLALRALGAHYVDYLVPNRVEDGYGLTPKVAQQALDKGAELIITVDNGISSFQGVLAAQAQGCLVLVTDHHLPGAQLPTADVIVNPNLATCQFPSKALAGVGVIFYVMLALRSKLQQTGWFEQQQRVVPNLAEYLDLVALGTVADLVPLDSNNRILVHQGLQRIRAGLCRPGIKALLDICQRQGKQLKASDLGFFLAPRLNAAGRLDHMALGVELLLCSDHVEARKLAYKLDELNQTRKTIEMTMKEEAIALCNQFTTNEEAMPTALALYHPEWHQGVIGILASQLKERFYRPVIAFAPAGNGLLKGSGRSIAGLHLRDLLERLHSQHPTLIECFGGHAMAAGLTIQEQALPTFQQAFSTLAEQWLSAEMLNNIIWSDGALTADELNLATAELLAEAGPWGQAFAEPLFDGEFKILQQRIVGERHLKLLLTPMDDSMMIDAIAFNCDLSIWPDLSIKTVEIAYQLDINEFRGNRQVQLIIRHLWPKG